MNLKVLEALLSGQDTEEINQLIDGVLNEYSPVIEHVFDKLVDAYEEYSEKQKKLAKIDAKIKKQSLDNYMEAGFSRDEAFALLVKDVITKKEFKDGLSKGLSSVDINQDNK